MSEVFEGTAAGQGSGGGWIRGPATAPSFRASQPAFASFEQMALADPERVVVDDGERRLTYGEIRREARHLAARIAAETPADRPIVILVRNDASFLVLGMAVLASGRIFVPMDEGGPADRNAAILADSGAGAVVTLEGEGDVSFLPPGMPLLRLGRMTGEDLPPLPAPRDLDAPAAIVYTSGSTGRPKGIVSSERQLLRLIDENIAWLALGPDDVVGGIAALSAGGLREGLGALLSGALLRPLEVKRIGLLEALKAMKAVGVTRLTLVPSVVRVLTQVPGIVETFARLRSIELFGESLLQADLEALRAILPKDCKVMLLFGATEVAGLFRWVIEDDQAVDGRLPSGRLMAGRCITLLDDDGRPAAPGEPGELVVSDDRVMLGYWRDGAVDERLFRAAPADPGVRTFHTGDIVRLGESGLAQFLGRRDRMVKVRGLKADLGEIEEALTVLREVDQAVAVPRQAAGGNTELVVFVSFVPGPAPPSQAKLRQAILDGTADHMTPHAIHVLDEIPRLHNGKPDLVRLTALAANP
jgi:acyl-coenzyme A synthetase/AMP-(fatty) acid ligase